MSAINFDENYFGSNFKVHGRSWVSPVNRKISLRMSYIVMIIKTKVSWSCFRRITCLHEICCLIENKRRFEKRSAEWYFSIPRYWSLLVFQLRYIESILYLELSIIFEVNEKYNIEVSMFLTLICNAHEYEQK